MADQRGVRRIRPAFIQQGLQPPGGPIEEEGFDSVGHISFYHSTQPSALSRQPKQNQTAKDAKDAKKINDYVPCSFAHFAHFAVTSLAEC